MNKIYNKKFDEVYYQEVLDNGLKVIINYKPEFKTSTCVIGTPYGALDIFQVVDGVEIKNNAGVAHFLEHKLFESGSIDVMTVFTSMGCSVNAFTSYNETCYYFKTTNKNIDKPLNLLLDFVQSLDIDQQSVEKEKGIIIQEVKMYDQMPDAKLSNEAYGSVYHQFPLKYDIGGDEDSINKISSNELESCYKRNYHPSNMTLVITTPIDPHYLSDLIKFNQNNKDFGPKPVIKRLILDESDEVVKDKVVVKMDVSSNKLAYTFKIKYKELTPLEKSNEEWSIRFLLDMHFSSLNPDYEKWLKNELINDYFGYEIDYGNGYTYMMFYSENCEADLFKSFIDTELNKIMNNETDQAKFTQLLKRYYGKSFDIFNGSEDMAIGLLRYYLSDLSYYETIEELLKLDLNQCLKNLKELDLSKNSLVEIKNY
jgi:predicted Zn-dependent peptidase